MIYLYTPVQNKFLTALAESVRKAFAKKIKELPRDLTKTLTYD
jgi:hypothetical protein